MATTEHTINDTLAAILRKTRYVWRDTGVIQSEQLGMLKDSTERPDILVIEPYVSPVVIEVEMTPAITVETEASSRLGKIMKSGKQILSAIAVRLPERIRKKQGTSISDELISADDIDMALYTGSDPAKFTRWPREGWIIGNVRNLSMLIQLASIPPEVIDKAADLLIDGIENATAVFNQITRNYKGAIDQISNELCQADSPQTRRMAVAILTNAFIFHEIIAANQDTTLSIKPFEQLRVGIDGTFIKSPILAEWRKILQVNYWPIFDIARRILEIVPSLDCYTFIGSLAETAEKLLQNQLLRSHDLMGTVFQRLIADRKFLAAYYTTPASASLLAGLAITPTILPSEKSWSDAADVSSLRIADFACGTGTLLSTAYQRISQLHEIAGGSSEKIHPQMMATALVGCDVLPAATHLTASMLAAAHPMVKYHQSSILTVAYGKQPDQRIALGSLDLLDPQGNFEVHSITAKVVEGMGEAEKETWETIPHTNFDVVIMNPPFTRATRHEGESLNVPNPMFAAFGSSAEEQKLMADAVKSLTKDSKSHGNAGEASMFLVLADRKLKQNGRLALIMPLSLISGESWENSRQLLAQKYSDLILISISASDDKSMSFSADTDMGECLLIGRKSDKGSKRAFFVILNERPAYPLVGASAAEQIRNLIESRNIRRLEDGPMGGTQVIFGKDIVGQILDAPLPSSGTWNVARISDISLAQIAYQITKENKLWLPSMTKSEISDIPITVVEKIGKIGPIDRDINGKNPKGDIRGPFDIYPIKPNSTPTYPVLWAHDAKRERTMMFDADSEGIARKCSTQKEQELVDLKVDNVWNTASHCHFNRSFRFNSQSTGMQFTPRKTIGGQAWTSIQLSSPEQEKALVLWSNTTLGLLLRWWHSNKQQSGRGSVTKLALHTLPVLDITALTQKQLKEAVKIFDAMCDQPMLPLHQMDKDPVRKKLDEQFGKRVLGLSESVLAKGGSLELLREKLCKEPSVRGNKK